MHIVQYDPSRKEEWDNFVRSSNNGTVFHEQQFLDYHEPGKFPFHHLMIYNGPRLRAVLPGALKDGGTFFESPAGASYGSFVIEDITAAESLEIVDTFLAYARSTGIKKIVLTPAPIIYQKKLSQNLDFALLYRSFAYTRHYISHAIELDEKDFLPRFQSTARKNIHKILREKTLTVKESDDFESFYNILVENKKKFNVKPTHTLEELYKLRELQPDLQKLFLVYLDNKPIAGSLLFLAHNRVAICFYNMLLYQFEKLHPIYAVMYEVVRWATENNFRWVDIGVSQDTADENPMTPALSLILFKERFNSRGILRSTMALELD